MGVVRVTYLLSMAEISSGSSFEPNNPTEQKLGYIRLRVVECENDLEKKTRKVKLQIHHHNLFQPLLFVSVKTT